MEYHWTLSDQEFEKSFLSCEFPPSEFNHEAHIRLAWINIRLYGIASAIDRIQSQLKRYVSHVGAEGKYNETLTVAAVKMVYHFMLTSSNDNFKDFIQEFPRLKYNFKELMASHYGFDIYNSELAKRQYLAPDLLPFD